METIRFTPLTSAAGAIERERLVRLVLSGRPPLARTTLVISPAGYGKTTLLVQVAESLAREDTIPIWLNCSREDQQPDTFLGNLAAALQAAGLFPDRLEFDVDDITRELAGTSSPTLVIIDEYENATSQATDALLELLIRSLPGQSRLVVASRQAPRLSLSRLILDGKARLIEAPELRLTDDESRAVMAELGDPDEVSGAVVRSEGWPVILQLMRLEIASGGRPTEHPLHGIESTAHVFDYLAAQVLASLQPAEQDLLQQLSILTEVDTGLAAAVTGRDDCYPALRQLLRLAPIITLIREAPFSVRLHPLFRDFLREVLKRSGGGSVGELHRRAALHFAGRGDYSTAMEHAMHSGDPQLGADILERAGGMLLNISEGQGRVRTFMNLVPTEIINTRPSLRLMRIAQQALEGISADWLADFERLQAGFGPHDGEVLPDTDFDLRLALVRLIVDTMHSAGRSPRPDWDLLSAGRRRCEERRFEDLRYLGCILPMILHAIHSYRSVALAEKQMAEVRQLYESAGFAPNLAWISIHEAIVAVNKGDLAEAESRANSVLHRIADLGETRNTSLVQTVNSCLGHVYYERGELELAVAHFEALPQEPAVVLPDTAARAFGLRALAMHDLDQSQSALTVLEAVCTRAVGEDMSVLSSLLATFVAQLRLLRGDVDGCHQMIAFARLEESLADLADDRSRMWIEREAVTGLFAGLWLREGKPAEALALATQTSDAAVAAGRRLTAARVLLLVARCHQGLGCDQAARAAIQLALDLTLGTGAIRPFLECGRDLHAHLRDIASDTPAGPLHDWLQRILEARTMGFLPPPEVLGVLTPREQEVLGHLGLNLPTKVLARRLRISPETVRHHLKHIYAKLGAGNRTHAVREARRRGLIP